MLRCSKFDRMTPARAERVQDERGSVALVVMVLFVMASLATVMVARDVSELHSVRTSQDRSVALAATDAGMAAGVARAAVETSNGFGESGVAGDATWQLRARRINEDRWELLVIAQANVSQRAASAGLVRRGGSGWVLSDWQEGGGQFCTFQDTLQQADESQQLLSLHGSGETQPRLSTGTRINTAADLKLCRALSCTGQALEQADETQQTLQQANQTQQRLSTGKRINSAADDAAGLATGTRSCQSQICDADIALETADQQLQSKSLNSAQDDAAGQCDQDLLDLTR